jgi:hypothetical protein
MKKYQVGVKIFNSFEVEAKSEEEAEEKVRELDVYKTLMDCDYNITYVDEIKSRDIPREMSEDLLNIKTKSFPTGSVDFGTSME